MGQCVLHNQDRMTGVHPDLVRVVLRAMAMAPFDVVVVEGLRTLARQRYLYDHHASTTMNSRHLDGHAVDLAPMLDGTLSWAWPQYYKWAPIMKAAATQEKVDIEWGGDWKFKDGPHWQLTWKSYPAGSHQ